MVKTVIVDECKMSCVALSDLTFEVWRSICNYLIPLDILKIELCLKYYYKKVDYEFGPNLWSYICEIQQKPQVPGLPVPFSHHRAHCVNMINNPKNWTLLLLNSMRCHHCIKLNKIWPEVIQQLNKFYPYLQTGQIWYTDTSGHQLIEGQEDIPSCIKNCGGPTWFPFLFLVPSRYLEDNNFLDHSFIFNTATINNEIEIKDLPIRTNEIKGLPIRTNEIKGLTMRSIWNHFRNEMIYPLSAEGFTQFVCDKIC